MENKITVSKNLSVLFGYLVALFFVFSGLQGMAQNENTYFTKSGMLVENPEDADIKYERREISGKKFELLEFRRLGEDWLPGANKSIISVKKNNQYSVEAILHGQFGMKNKIEVVDTTDIGFIIREYSNGFCNTEAEVLSVFPRVYHGSCKFFSSNKDENPQISHFYKNLEFKAVKQPELVEAKTPEIDVEQLPEYPGGIAQFLTDLLQEMVVPADVTEDDLKDVFLLSFTVDASGRLTDPHVLKEGKPLVDQALVKACIQIEKPWMPAVRNQKNCDFTYLVPLNLAVNTSEKPDPDKVFTTVEKMPEYLGGEEGLRRDIALNIRYPVAAMQRGIQGKVFVGFIVDADGGVRNIHVVRGVHPLLDSEALRVVSTLGKWIPGELAGVKVCVSYTVPISFVLLKGNISNVTDRQSQ